MDEENKKENGPEMLEEVDAEGFPSYANEQNKELNQIVKLSFIIRLKSNFWNALNLLLDQRKNKFVESSENWNRGPCGKGENSGRTFKKCSAGVTSYSNSCKIFTLKPLSHIPLHPWKCFV